MTCRAHFKLIIGREQSIDRSALLRAQSPEPLDARSVPARHRLRCFRCTGKSAWTHLFTSLEIVFRCRNVEQCRSWLRPLVLAGSRAFKPASHRQSLRTLAILSALMAFGPLSTDFYLPALPTMADALHSNPGAMEWTISSYLIGCSVGQLIWGPLSDQYGRRGPVAIGIAIFILGSVGCALSTSVGAMIAWRVLQAIGACAGISLSRAMVRDLYSGARAAQMMSALITVMAITPLIGPLVGGQILRWPVGRHFWLLAAVGVAALLALMTLPETLPPDRRRRDGLGKALRTYYWLLRRSPDFRLRRDRRVHEFRRVRLCRGNAVRLYQPITGFDPEFFGFVFSSGILGIMATNVFNARQVMRSGIVPMLRLGRAWRRSGACGRRSTPGRARAASSAWRRRCSCSSPPTGSSWPIPSPAR